MVNQRVGKVKQGCHRNSNLMDMLLSAFWLLTLITRSFRHWLYHCHHVNKILVILRHLFFSDVMQRKLAFVLPRYGTAYPFRVEGSRRARRRLDSLPFMLGLKGCPETSVATTNYIRYSFVNCNWVATRWQ